MKNEKINNIAVQPVRMKGGNEGNDAAGWVLFVIYIAVVIALAYFVLDPEILSRLPLR
jgi:hypothetical protein